LKMVVVMVRQMVAPLDARCRCSGGVEVAAMVVCEEEELAVAVNLKVFAPAAFFGVVACAEWFEVAGMFLRRWWPAAMLHLDGVAKVIVAVAEMVRTWC